MDHSQEERLAGVEAKLDAVLVSVEKVRKYLFWTLVVTLVTFVVPLLLLVIVVPWFLSSYLGSFEGLL